MCVCVCVCVCVWCLPDSSAGTFLCFSELGRRSDRKSEKKKKEKKALVKTMWKGEDP